MQNQQKKTLRHFQCRDFLWEIFEQMGGELECSIDYLINEAMRQYARSRNYGPRSSSMAMPAVGMPGGSVLPPLAKPGTGPLTGPPTGSTTGALTAPAAAAAPGAATGPTSAPVVPQTSPTARPSAPPQARPPVTGPTAPTTSPKTAAASVPATPATRARALSGPPPAPASVPPPPPSAPPQLPTRPSASGAATLHIIFAGQKMPLLKDPFVIGRGSKTSDLAIKDGNISRKHAVVVRHEGAFYMKDLGSTNGVLWNGRRIESKRIEEGDVFHICDYELRFTYK